LQYHQITLIGDVFMKIRLILGLFLAAFVAEGCQSSQSIAPKPEERPPITPEKGLPTQGVSSYMTPSAPWLESLVEQAQKDMSGRLSIAGTDIRVVSAEEVVWPDSSLGCPQAGMAYAQILTPGYLVVLEYAGNQYEYHAGKGQEVFYCPNPTAPVPGTPGNT
jgi:hypothetical protein